MGGPAVSDQCPASAEYVGISTPRIGVDRVACPVCGKTVQFHRITGRLARHNKPTITVRLTTDQADAVLSSLHEHLAGDVDDLFQRPGLNVAMATALRKVQRAVEKAPAR